MRTKTIFVSIAIGTILMTVLPAQSACNAGARNCPIELRMARGSDTITVMGTTSPQRDCCTYRFRARRGQTLHWKYEGPTSRLVITYPDGNVDGPGIPSVIALPSSGDYRLDVRPNLMAENAFGSFKLSITIK